MSFLSSKICDKFGLNIENAATTASFTPGLQEKYLVELQ